MLKQLAGTVLSLLLSLGVVAQERVVIGIVSSSRDNLPLKGVSIKAKGVDRLVVTDDKGAFRLAIPSKIKSGTVILSFNLYGYISQLITIKDQNPLNIRLHPSESLLQNKTLDIGYFQNVTDKENTGTASFISGSAFVNQPFISFNQALQGRVAGVHVLSANGLPGGVAQVRVRGTGSIMAGNDPLYIVDGVQINTRDDGNGIVNINPLSFLNPDDIESLTVLKDAGSTAIYGSQGANGVVLVTTKKGSYRSKPKIQLSYYGGVVERTNNLDVLSTSEFISARTEALRTTTPTASTATIRNTVLSELGLKTNLTDEQLAAIPTYDWQKELYRTGTIHNVNVSVQGGSDKSSYYLSTAYHKQESSLNDVATKRFSALANLTQKLGKKVWLDEGVRFSNVNQQSPYGNANGTTSLSAPQFAAPMILPLNPIYNSDGSYSGMPASKNTLSGDVNSNLVANADYYNAKGITNQFVGNLALNYQLSDAFLLRAFGGLDYRSLSASSFGDPRLSDFYVNQGILTQLTSNNLNFQTNATLQYKKIIASSHAISVFGGIDYRYDTNKGLTTQRQGFSLPSLNAPADASEIALSSSLWNSFKMASAFGSVRYDYNKRYLFSVNARYDGSSRFGQNNRWGFFPGASARWNLKEEKFLKTNPFINDLAIRASAGITGNQQFSTFASQSLYTTGTTYQGNQGIRLSQLSNSDLRWEENIMYNTGIDYGFLEGKVRGSLDVFQRVSRGLLLTRQIPAVNGLTSVLKNSGSLRNRGIELVLNTTNLSKGELKWETGVTFTLQDNQVTKLVDSLTYLPDRPSVRVGSNLFTNFGVPYIGANPANGRPVWLDVNGNITYQPRPDDQRSLGHANYYKQFGGVNNTFSYKGFELNAFLTFELGAIAQNAQESQWADNGATLRNSLSSYWANRWTTPGQITSVPRPAQNRSEISSRIASYQTDSRFFQDASFIRFRQLTASYTFPSELTRYLGITNLKLYGQAVNLFTWTKWTGQDPEFVDLNGSGNQGIVPQPRIFTMGVQVGL